MLVQVIYDKLNREVFNFIIDLAPFRAVLQEWSKEHRESGRHKWVVERRWNWSNKRLSNAPEPKIPPQVITDVKQTLINMIEVLTWEEFKSRRR